MARPIPRDAPVTNATFPFRSLPICRTIGKNPGGGNARVVFERRQPERLPYKMAAAWGVRLMDYFDYPTMIFRTGRGWGRVIESGKVVRFFDIGIGSRFTVQGSRLAVSYDRCCDGMSGRLGEPSLPYEERGITRGGHCGVGGYQTNPILFKPAWKTG